MRRSIYLLVAILTFGLGTSLALLFSAKYLANKAATSGCENVEAVPSVVAEELDAYAVFSAVIRARYGQGSDNLVVIRNYAGNCNYTGYDPSMPENGEELPNVPADLYREYRAKYRQCMNLENLFDSRVSRAYSDFIIPYTLISDREMEELNPAGRLVSGLGTAHRFWENFNAKYKNSDGIISFSRVAFDPSRDRALVFVSHSCDYTCGEGYFVLLRREHGEWKVQRTINIWIA